MPEGSRPSWSVDTQDLLLMETQKTRHLFATANKRVAPRADKLTTQHCFIYVDSKQYAHIIYMHMLNYATCIGRRFWVHWPQILGTLAAAFRYMAAGFGYIGRSFWVHWPQLLGKLAAYTRPIFSWV